jgi:hypothetical protein
MKVDNVPIATSISTSLPIAFKRTAPISTDWETYKAWLQGGRKVDYEAFKAWHKGELAHLEQKQATTTKKKPASRQKKKIWEFYETTLNNASKSKYWDVGIEGKRIRNLKKPSYADNEARSDSEDDTEDAFNPQTAVESSSESDNEPIAKKLVCPPSPPNPPLLTSN